MMGRSAQRRQAYEELAAAPRAGAAGADRATVELHQVSDERQAKAGTSGAERGTTLHMGVEYSI